MEISLSQIKWQPMAKEHSTKENSSLPNKSKTKFLIEELISNKSPPRHKPHNRDHPTEEVRVKLSPNTERADSEKLPRNSPTEEPQNFHNRSSPYPLLHPQSASSIPVLHAWNGPSQFNQHVAFHQPSYPPFVQRFLTPEQQHNMAWLATQTLNEHLHSRLLASSLPYANVNYNHEGNYMYAGSLHRQKRIRTAFTPHQQLELEKAFQANKYLVGQERKQLARNLQLTETQIKVWFQNRRTKTRRTDQSTEIDCKSRINKSSTESTIMESSASSESSDESHMEDFIDPTLDEE